MCSNALNRRGEGKRAEIRSKERIGGNDCPPAGHLQLHSMEKGSSLSHLGMVAMVALSWFLGRWVYNFVSVWLLVWVTPFWLLVWSPGAHCGTILQDNEIFTLSPHTGLTSPGSCIHLLTLRSAGMWTIAASLSVTWHENTAAAGAGNQTGGIGAYDEVKDNSFFFIKKRRKNWNLDKIKSTC